jgi:hypothetical protein
MGIVAVSSVFGVFKFLAINVDSVNKGELIYLYPLYCWIVVYRSHILLCSTFSISGCELLRRCLILRVSSFPLLHSSFLSLVAFQYLLMAFCSFLAAEFSVIQSLLPHPY